jgi:ABC-2 type transport system ATP-binding protein
MSEAIVASDVRKCYGETVALDDVSLSAQDGEIVALVGPNGAGKTTFVRVVTGTTEPSDGAVTILDQSPGEVDRSRLGVLPQSFAPPERLTARELLTYYAGLYDTSRAPETVLADVGLAAVDDVWYEQLSGGQQRRVCLGAAIVNDPELVVLDEPTTGIDPAGRRTVREQIGTLADAGATVLMTTHDMSEAERLADRVALLADGQLRAVGSPDDLIAEHGGPSRLLVETTDTVEPFDGGGPDLPSGMGDGLHDDLTVESADDGLVIRNVDPTDIGSIVELLEGRGVAYEALSWREPDLEDVYMSLAGAEEIRGTRRQEVTS